MDVEIDYSGIPEGWEVVALKKITAADVAEYRRIVIGDREIRTCGSFDMGSYRMVVRKATPSAAVLSFATGDFEMTSPPEWRVPKHGEWLVAIDVEGRPYEITQFDNVKSNLNTDIHGGRRWIVKKAKKYRQFIVRPVSGAFGYQYGIVDTNGFSAFSKEVADEVVKYLNSLRIEV